mmetsp:Transcript_26711/g.106962  ORF Transcript_26711/g.106962 Transcript_26711/m.106962 type:complete len:200 (-) Transcript_26711:200-799(-)
MWAGNNATSSPKVADERQPLIRAQSIDESLADIETSLHTLWGAPIPYTGLSILSPESMDYDVVDVAVRVIVAGFVQGEVYMVHHEYYNKVCRRYAKIFWISVMLLLEVLLVTTVFYANKTSVWPPTWAWILRHQSLSKNPGRGRLVREILALIFMTAVWVALLVTYLVVYAILLAFFVSSDSAMNNLFETNCHKSFAVA